ncbi:MAG: orotate phosphoribosyltransferase [Bacteroidota bacterium]|nr:orotate phosphoribosyltransferase [Bacteroidota bacterium]
MKTEHLSSGELSQILLAKKAVKLSPDKGFTWASGIKSPIYCDNRKLLSYPKVRSQITKTFANYIRKNFPAVDVIAGVATGAIAWGVLVAQELEKSFIYVRSNAKAHGLANRIEGEYKAGDVCLVIEDLVSTGGSSLEAVKALREEGMGVKEMMALFSYDLPVSKINFETAECQLTTLTNFEDLLQTAEKTGYIKKPEKHGILEWQKKQGS